MVYMARMVLVQISKQLLSQQSIQHFLILKMTGTGVLPILIMVMRSLLISAMVILAMAVKVTVVMFG